MAQVKALIGNIKGKDGMANVYSTSETVIGTWNGSTLYRKMFKTNIPTVSNGANTTTTIPCGVSYTNIKSVYLLDARPSTTAFSTLGISAANDIYIYVSQASISINSSNSFYNGASCYAVIEYIK